MTSTRLGIACFDSQPRRCSRIMSAFTTSGTVSVQPGYSRTKMRSSDGMSDRVLYRLATRLRKYAGLWGWESRYCASRDVRTLALSHCGEGAYSPKPRDR